MGGDQRGADDLHQRAERRHLRLRRGLERRLVGGARHAEPVAGLKPFSSRGAEAQCDADESVPLRRSRSASSRDAIGVATSPRWTSSGGVAMMGAQTFATQP